MIKKFRNNVTLKAAFAAIGLVFGVYIVTPTLVAWAVFVPSFIRVILKGIGSVNLQGVDKYVANMEGFLAQLTLLIGSGLLAVWIWSRRKDLHIFPHSRRWGEVFIGIGIGVLDYYCVKKLIAPWLYMARPIGLEWSRPEYGTIEAYHGAYINQIAELFFIGIIYTPVVETLVFIGMLYRRLRYQWGYVASVLLGAVIFATGHRDELLFLRLIIFALINFTLYELRKSLAAPLFHHVTFNAFVYGSQLALFSGFPSA